MEVFYCKQWFRYNKVPTDPLTVAEAERSHANGQLFTALLGSPTRPYCFLEFSAFRSVCVEFLDDLLRTYLVHSFQEKHPNEFFLSSAIKRGHLLDTDHVVRGDVYYFKTDGDLLIHFCTIDLEANRTVIDRKGQHRIDVSNNWEPFPAFGQYEGLAR